MASRTGDQRRSTRKNLSGFLFFVFTMVLLCNVNARAQGMGGTMNAETATPIPGVGHDYQHLLSETVDPSSGQVSFRFDQPVPPSRGFTLPVALTYNSAYVHTDQSVTGALQFSPTVNGPWPGGGPVGQGGPYNGGWNVPMPMLTYSAWYQLYYNYSAGATGAGHGSPDGSIGCQYASNYAFMDKTGTVHNLNLGYSLTGPITGLYVSPSDCYQANTAHSSGAGDSQFSATFTNPTITGSNAEGYDITDPSVTVQDLSDGTIYYFNKGNIIRMGNTNSNIQVYPTSITDRNGNTEVMGGNAYVADTAGRPAGWSGFYTLTQSTIAVPSYSIPIQSDPSPGTNAVCPSSGHLAESLSVTVVSQISMPGGLSYNIYYGTNNPTDSSLTNPWGLVNEIVYPDGGWVKYYWTTSVGGTYSQMLNYNATAATNPSLYGTPAQCEILYATPVVAERVTSYDGVNIAETQTFQYATSWPAQVTGSSLLQPNWTSKTTSVVTTDNVSGLSFLKTYSYAPITLAPAPFSVGYSANQLPVETNVTTYSGSTTSTKALDITTKGWFNQFLQACEFHTSDGLSAGHFLNYQYNIPQPSDDKEYEYGQISSPASVCFNAAWPAMPSAPSSPIPARETATTFQLADVYRPCKTVTLNSAAASVAETDLYYDGGTTLCASGSGNTTQPVSNLPTGTHNEASYGPSSTLSRGNVTKIVRINGSGVSPTTTYTYDETGQITSVTAPCGNTTTCSDVNGGSSITQYSHTDSPSGGNAQGNSNAYLTQITYPTPNGVTLKKNFTYNYTTGELAGSVDENGQPTIYNYDSLLRLTDAYGPPDPQNGNSQPHTHYGFVDGAAASITTTNPIGVISKDNLDGMGHVTSTVLTDPEGNDVVDTVYDGEGHLCMKSNPYRGTPSSLTSCADPNAPYTSYQYDALGRKTFQLDSDGVSHQTWSYSGSTVTYTDENNNQWKRTSDALGRLIKVLEPNGFSTLPSMETGYAYDALNNLTSVWQWGGVKDSSGARLRSFYYDSLSRLTTAVNPESGTIKYTYDANGNVATKTDARNVVTTYSYDTLNRLLRKTYSADPGNTPFSCFQYDSSSVTNGIGRLANAWTVSAPASTCAATAPATGFLTKRSFFAYDPMGRITQEQQYTLATQAGGTPYSPVYKYDLAGNLIFSTSGVGPTPTSTPITLGYTLNAAGRLQTVTSNLTGNTVNNTAYTYPTTLFSPPSTLQSSTCANSTSPSPQYAAFGGLMNAAFGGGLTLNRGFDSRLRTVCEVDMGGVGNATGGSTTVMITGTEKTK